MDNLTDVVQEFGRRVAQIEANNNGAVGKASEALNIAQATRTEKWQHAMSRLQDGLRDSQAATAKIGNALAELEAIEATSASDMASVAADLLILRSRAKGKQGRLAMMTDHSY